jgi:NAD(P)-dependent dehydrogenase (short-subunit alcohol dehydrogenase family)
MTKNHAQFSMRLAVMAASLICLLAPGATATATAAGEAPLAVKPTRELSGKVAIVTGAARNLGRGYAVALGRMGADVVIHYHQPDDRADAEETARQVREFGVRTLLVSGDLSELSTIDAMFDATMKEFSRVDIVINNAGLMVKKPLSQVTEDEFDRSFGINAKAPFFIMQRCAKHMAENGRIINIGTSLISTFTPNYSAYAGSKASMEQFTRMFAREIGARGITVNCVAPGPVDTPFFRAPESPENIAYATRLAVAGRLGQVDDIVPLIEFLASPKSQWITGQTLFINGGYMGR